MSPTVVITAGLMIRNVKGDRKLTDLCLSEKTWLPHEAHAIGFPGGHEALLLLQL